MAVMTSPVVDPLAPKTLSAPEDDSMVLDTEINGNGLNGHVESSSPPGNDITMSDAILDDVPTINGKTELSVDPADGVIPAKSIEPIVSAPPAVQHATSIARDEPLPGTAASVGDVELKDAPESDASGTPEGLKDNEDQTTAPGEQSESSPALPTTEDALSPSLNDEKPPTPANEPSPIPQTQDMLSPPAETQDSVPTQSAGQVRPREDESDVEPLAKRAKTEETQTDNDIKSETTQVPATPIDLPGSTTGAENSTMTPMDFDSNSLTKAQSRYLLDCIRKAKKIKNAAAFLVPVDIVALNIPNYPNIVKNPMDLGTMEEKLKNEKYSSANALWVDFEQMVQNSILFNGQQHDVSQRGMALKAYFAKLMQSLPKGDAATEEVRKPKPPPPPPVRTSQPRREARIIRPPPPAPAPTPKSVPPTPKDEVKPQLDQFGTPLIRRESQVERPKREIKQPNRELVYTKAKPKKKGSRLDLALKFSEWVNKEVLKTKYKGINWPFISPVDVVALNIPTYRNVVKKPMDFGTIAEKLRKGDYNNAKQYHDDAKLVFQNCYAFNAPGDNISNLGRQLEQLFDEFWTKKDDWILENTPQSEPASEEDESDEDEEIMMDPNAKAARIAEITQQIFSLTTELNKLTSSASAPTEKAPKSKKSGDSGKKQKRASLPSTTKQPKVKKQKKQRKLSLEEKRYVSEGIGGLDEINMRKAVQIIRNGVPSLKNVHDDELELDVDEIPDDVLKELYNFVRAFKRQNGQESASDEEYEDDRRASVTAPPKNRKKNKPMSAREQENKIAQVRQQLETFQNDGVGGGGFGAQDESSEDDSSSSSEEE